MGIQAFRPAMSSRAAVSGVKSDTTEEYKRSFHTAWMAGGRLEQTSQPLWGLPNVWKGRNLPNFGMPVDYSIALHIWGMQSLTRCPLWDSSLAPVLSCT